MDHFKFGLQRVAKKFVESPRLIHIPSMKLIHYVFSKLPSSQAIGTHTNTCYLPRLASFCPGKESNSPYGPVGPL